MTLYLQRHVVSLRSGSGLPVGNSSRSNHSRAMRSFIGSTPGEYIMSLLRTTHHEDGDCLPVNDLYGYVWIIDHQLILVEVSLLSFVLNSILVYT